MTVDVVMKRCKSVRVVVSTLVSLAVCCVLYYWFHSMDSINDGYICDEVPLQVLDTAYSDDVEPAAADDAWTESTAGPKLGLSPTATGPPVKAVIFTRYRSGSSFVGELFSHHPDIYYIFEPFIVSKNVPNMTYAHINAVSKRELDRILSCDFNELFRKYRMYPSANRALFRGLWKRVFCTSGVSATTGDVRNELGPVCTRITGQTPGTTRQLCRRYRHLVVKTICLRNMSVIRDLLEEQTKIIHLLRDPRGQIGSIMSLMISKGRGRLSMNNFTPRWVETESRRICTDINSTLSQVRRLFRGDPFLRMNYVLVRYEDVALSPSDQTKSLYDFLGLEMTKNVSDWIQQSTKQSVSGVYSTKRNSSVAATSWMGKLPLTFIKVIQENCADVLRLLGYRTIHTESDLGAIDPVGDVPLLF